MNKNLYKILVFIFCLSSTANAQETPLSKNTLHPVFNNDSTINRNDKLTEDTIKTLMLDSLAAHKADSLHQSSNDSIPPLNADSIELAKADSIAMAKADSIVMAKADSVAQLKADSLAKAKADSIAANKLKKEQEFMRICLSKTDSTALAYNYKMNKLSKRFEKYKYTQPDTLANPYYFYIFAQPTYYSMPTHEMIGVLDPAPSWETNYTPLPLLPEGSVTPQPLLSSINRALSEIYIETPQFITQNEDLHLSESGIRSDVNKDVKPEVKLTEKVEDGGNTITDNFKNDDWDIVVHRPNFWTFKANFAFQMMQYFVSDNWYKGGESNYSWLASSVMEANYNNKQKITFDNKLEMRLGFQSSKGDEKHKFRANSDLLRLTNKFGMKATKHWYYTLMLQSWTQFYPSYKKNDEKVYSDFMSPFESILTLGMDYKLELKKFSLNATISPFAGNFKYVDRKALAPSFGIDEGKHNKFDFGSNITVRYNWNIMKNVSWGGRIFYFTDYETTRVEWENTFNLVINKFLSTKLFIYPRFDDGVKKMEGKSYFQFHETLSVGFNYNF